MRFSLFIIAYLFLPVMMAAQQNQPQYDQWSVAASQCWIDIDYAGDNITGHKLDIFLPKSGAAPFPVVVAVYGSAWFSNNSKGATFQTGLGQALLQAGYAVISVNHRSSRDAVFPAQIQDVKAAIRFIRGNSKAFQLDTGFVGITGWSSGGHLSSFAGVSTGIKSREIDGQSIELEGAVGKFTEFSSDVDAVVDWFGPTDFLIMDQCGSSFSHDDPKSPESSLVGGSIQENKTMCALANPSQYTRSGNPPFLIFHGDKDPLVPHCQSQQLYDGLQKAGVDSELVIIKDGGHGPGVMIPVYYEQMIAFFDKKSKR